MAAALPSDKQVYPPLLEVGFHTLSMADLRQLCVDAFPKSRSRAKLSAGFEKVLERVRASGLRCEVWVNGSYLTRKIDPDDVDFIVRFEAEVVENANEEQEAAIGFLTSDLSEHGCHSFVHIEYPKDHPHHWLGVWMQAYWLKQWGFARDDSMKGIAVIKIGIEE